MIIVTADNDVIETSVDPISMCTGYRAKNLVMEAGDFERLAELVRINPEGAVAVLLQLDARMSRNRPTPKDYDDVEKIGVFKQRGNTND